MRVQKKNKAFAYRVPIGDYNYLQCVRTHDFTVASLTSNLGNFDFLRNECILGTSFPIANAHWFTATRNTLQSVRIYFTLLRM